MQGEVRISKMDYTSDSARQYGPMPRWHHVQCFLSLRDTLQFYGAAKDLPSFYALPADIQDDLKEKIKPMCVFSFKVFYFWSMGIVYV